MSESKFINRFRVSRALFDKILDMIRCDITHKVTTANNTIPASKRIAITLRYIASGDNLNTLSDLFGVGDSTIHAVIKEVVYAIANCKTLQDLVKFPSTELEFHELSKRLFDMFQFPNVIGAVDDTHIPIVKPLSHNDPSSYFDYKKNYSIHLQAVCDADTKILFYHIGAPGKNNDGGVMELSGLKNMLLCGRIPDKYHMVGDPAFPLHTNLLTRFPGIELEDYQSRYNWRQSRCRMVVESLFGRLKGRFRVLLYPMPFKSLDMVNKVIKACLLLHNFIVNENDDISAKHCFDDDEYRTLMKNIDLARETALKDIEEQKKLEPKVEKKRGRPKKTSESLPAEKEKRQRIVGSLESVLNETNCVQFLGM